MGLRSVLACAILPAACIDSGLSVCPTSGRVCGEGLVCHDQTDTCLSARIARCGNSTVDNGEECDDGNKLSHDGCSSTCLVELPVWTMLEPASGGERMNTALAYDAYRGIAVEFGGNTTITSGSDQTRMWSGAIWTYPGPLATKPASRKAAAMAYDPNRQRLVLFGGTDSLSSAALGDTWVWGQNGWTPLQPTTPPPPRADHGMATVGDRVLLFGGAAPAGASLMEFDDTWEWHGDQWTQLTPAASPPARYRPRIAEVNGGAVIYGSNFASGLQDTWHWNGKAWTQKVATGPGVLRGHAMAYTAPGWVILFGGQRDLDRLSETWLWDGTAWAKLDPATSPSKRAFHAMTYDAVHRYTILVGGGDIGTFSDTWAFRYEREGASEETCIAGEDGDGDGTTGCDDPDCWGYCTPHCPPGTASCDAAAPRCGDGECNTYLEPTRCPEDPC